MRHDFVIFEFGGEQRFNGRRVRKQKGKNKGKKKWRPIKLFLSGLCPLFGGGGTSYATRTGFELSSLSREQMEDRFPSFEIWGGCIAEDTKEMFIDRDFLNLSW